MKKKILIDARLYGLENTGIGRYILNLIEELKELKTNHQFVVLLRKKYFDQLKLPRNWEKIVADFGPYDFAEQIKLPPLLFDLKPDLVHFPHINIPVFWRGKFVVTVHDMTMHHQGIDATKLPIPIYFLKRIPYRYSFRQAVITSSNIIAPSNVVKKEIVSYFKINEQKVTMIYEGVDNNFLDSKVSLQKRDYDFSEDYFVYYGNVYPHKNVARLIQAMVELNVKSANKVNLAISCSRNTFTENLTALIKEKGAETFVRFFGFVKDEDLVSLLKNSKGLVYPSLAEGYGLQGLEAMASGTVVLASKIPIFKEIYDDMAFYFDPQKVDSISASMEYVLKMKSEDREMLIKKGKEFIKKYSWKKMAEETLKIYEGALSEK